MVIFTTIQAQDFPDVEGDAAIGRVTFPIYAPEFSRIFTFMATTGWSVCLCWFWDIGPCSTVAVALIGGYVGCRYYIWRDAKTDSQSYILYNVRFQLCSYSHTYLTPFRSAGWLLF